jgi:hypothetical protein
MNITELIKKLEAVRAEKGDIEVVTNDYTGGDNEDREPTVAVREPDQWNGLAEPVLVLNG